MNDTTSSPSRLLKITAVTARWLLGLVMAAWLVFVLSIAVLHGWIVPRIDDYRGALEAQASRVIGVSVQIGTISATTTGLFPSFELRDVVLRDRQQREALRLQRVVVSASPRSLWRLNFEQLYIENPSLDMRRDTLGKLHIAGLDVTTEAASDSTSTEAIDWFFAQRELVIEGGTVRWTDELRRADPLLLTDVRFVSRNSARRHAVRLDATPPVGWGQRFTLRGEFRQPLLSLRSGNWQSWDGTLYAELPQIDVSRLGRYITLDESKVRQGNGALRVWIDIQNGTPVGGTADLALNSVDVLLGAKLEPLTLRNVRGRIAGSLSGQAPGETLEFSTTDLQFDKTDGSHWPGGNLWFQHRAQIGRTPEHTALRADKLDLAALAQIASRLPLGEALHDALATYAPRGLVERIDASWQGALPTPLAYRATGRVSGLQVASQPPAAASVVAAVTALPGTGSALPPPGTPGLRGATIEFDATQAGGTATLGIVQGALDFPGVFEEPVIAIDQLSTQAEWQHTGAQLHVKLRNLRFANADAQGLAQADWHASAPDAPSAKSAPRSGSRLRPTPLHDGYPGVLDLQGQLTRANGTRAFRYLPLHIPRHVRDYVRNAVTHAGASTVDFRVRGDLRRMPFTDPKDGLFRIAAKLDDVSFDYVPSTGTVAGRPTASATNVINATATAPAAKDAPLRWPALTHLSGELIFQGASMQVRNARGRVVGAPGVEITRAEASIANLGQPAPLLRVEAQSHGPLSEMLQVAAPLTGDANALLSQTRATGAADLNLKLDLPLAALDQTKVQVALVLNGNDLQMTPELPTFAQARGTLNFSETGFALAGVQAQLAGGDIRVEGHGRYAAAQPIELSFSATGNATAEGLRGLHQVEGLAKLATQVSGGAAYAAHLTINNGVPEFLLTSTLQGLGLQWPAPLQKPADQPLALRIERKIVLRDNRPTDNPASAAAPATLHDEVALTLGRVASARYVRDVSGSAPRVLRGALQIGSETEQVAEAAPELPDQGVAARLNLGLFDLSAWQALLDNDAPRTASAAPTAAPSAGMLSAYLPSTIALRAQGLSMAGHHLHNLVVGGSRDGLLWRATVAADELNGYIEYRQPPDSASNDDAGRIYARLARLRIAATEASEVESLLEGPGNASPLPGLDVVIDDFELLGKRLGRAEINAANRSGTAREWRLNLLNLTTPEAKFQAKGSWTRAPASGARRTALDFSLDIADAGALLARLGMPGVLQRGNGRMQGEVAWSGSPFSLDYPSLNGQLNVNVKDGQFLKADPGLAKLLGVLSLQALPRRLSLDFRDVFSTGFAFDFIRGDATLQAGTASTNNLQMKGVNAAVLMDGSADIARETQNLHVVIVPELDAGTAALVATAINPAIGLATFIAQMMLRKPLIAAATQEFDIDGSWADPKMTKVARRPVPGSSDAPGPTGRAGANANPARQSTP